MTHRDANIRALRAARPRRRATEISVWLAIAVVVATWGWGPFHVADLIDADARVNLARFAVDITPYPLRDAGWSVRGYAEWFRNSIWPVLPDALFRTFALATVATMLAVGGALLWRIPANRRLMRREPYAGAVGVDRYHVMSRLARGAMLYARSIPEFVWAFLLLALLGVGPWPAVLALAVHNAGVLGRLYAETDENARPDAVRALRAMGATRTQLAVHVLAPRHVGRYLLYAFYRWETCVREATVLGLLGFVSLGWYVQDARAGARLDEMVHMIAFGAVLIGGGDLVSEWVRRRVRHHQSPA